MIKKDILLFSILILVGFSDWLTTLVGIAFFGAAETNPLMLGLVNTNMILFSAVKLSAVVAAGLGFYKATGLNAGLNCMVTKRFVDVGFCVVFLFLTCIVINNLSVILSL